MQGLVKSYRRGVRTQRPKQIILVVKGITSKKGASAVIGKSVSWKSPGGKRMNGKVTATHGDKGAVRARFERALPGSAIGARVTVQ